MHCVYRKALGKFVTEKVSEGERRRQDGAVKKPREKRAIGCSRWIERTVGEWKKVSRSVIDY